MPNLSPAEWVAIAAVVVALLGNVATVLTTWMNNRSSRSDKLYEERTKRIVTTYAAFLDCADTARGMNISLFDKNIDRTVSLKPILFDKINTFRKSYQESAIFLPHRTVELLDEYFGRVFGQYSYAAQIIAEDKGKEPDLMPIDDYNKVIRPDLFRLENKVSEELRRLIHE